MASCLKALVLLVIFGFFIEEIRSHDDELPSQDDDDGRVQVAQIFNQISTLMRKDANIIKPAIENDAVVFDAPIFGAIPENDMILSVEQAEMILNNLVNDLFAEKNGSEPAIAKRVSVTEQKWTFPIKYAFDGSHDDNEKAMIRQGLEMWKTTTCVRFEEYPSKSQVSRTNALIFVKGNGCNSNVGRSGSTSQTVSLGDGCVYPGITAHEVGHALGLYHEHMRPDRDGYIKINLANIGGPFEYAFAKVSPGSDNNYGCPYDYSSIMHYNSLGFSSDYWGKKRVIETIDPLFLTSIGQRDGLSFIDAKRINLHYKCIESSCKSTKLSQPCQNGGYQDPNNCVKCRCPPGYGGDFCQTFATSTNAKCGGAITLAQCSSTIITSPNYPSAFKAGTNCAWTIEAPSGSGLVFGFENQPGLNCDDGDTCHDYVEIRASDDPTQLGPRFCQCGLTSGRVVAVDRNKAVVLLKSFSEEGSKGFRLNVYATCPGTAASALTKECVISKSGYDYAGTRGTADSGQTCAIWSGQNSFGALNFPGGTLMAAGRACRNPDSRTSPWCYTNSGYQSTAFCTSIPTCPTGFSPALPIDAPTTGKSHVEKPRVETTQAVTTKKPSGGGSKRPVLSPTACRLTVEGREYIGTVSETKSGIPCQSWSKQWPNKHSFTSNSMFPDGSVAKAGSYCRNPDPNFKDGVWCYTLDPAVKRELCNVPMCSSDTPITEWYDKTDDELGIGKRFWRTLKQLFVHRDDNDNKK